MVRYVPTIQFWFWPNSELYDWSWQLNFVFRRKTHLYNQSRIYPIWFSSQLVLDSIDHDSSISFVSQIAPVLMVTSLSCLVFVTTCNRSDRSRQFGIVFKVECTYTINRVVVLSGFHHRLHPIRSVMIVQYHFQSRTHLYNLSSHCHVWFSSQIILSQIGPDSLVSFWR